MAVVPPGNATHIQIHANIPAAQVGYGSIFSRINTESANTIMTTRGTTSGITCDFDLTKRQGFRLKPGRNSVEIAVPDSRGRLRYASFLLELTVQAGDVAPPAPIVTPAGERFALIVGVSRYRAASMGVRELALADRDAAGIRDFLITPAGAHRAENVQLLLNEDATLERIRSALSGISEKATANDVVLVFLSGHAVVDPSDPRKNYVLAHDSRPGAFAETALAFSEIEDFYGRMLKAKHVTTVVEVARANAVSGGAAAGNGLVHQYLTRYASSGSRAAMAAADLGETSWEGSASAEGHGVFAQFLLEGLKGAADSNRDGTVTFGEVRSFVREQVRRATGGQQSPIAVPGDGDAIALAGLRARPSR